MTASATTNMLNGLLIAAPQHPLDTPNPQFPHSPTMERKPGVLAPTVRVTEIPASSGWSVSSAGSSRPGSVREKRRSRGFRGVFSRSRAGSGKQARAKDHDGVIVEEELLPRHRELHRRLELTALKMREDGSVSSATPIASPVSLNPRMSYTDTLSTEEEFKSISEAVGRTLATATPTAESPSSENMGLHSMFSRAKRMSMTSIQGARPSTATSITSSPSSPFPPTQAPPTKKRSSIFPSRSSKPASSNPVTPPPSPHSSGQEFFKALQHAKKHSTLPHPSLPAPSIITMSSWKSGDVLALGRRTTSESAKLKLKKQIADVINKAGWTSRIFVLTAGSASTPPYILQFAVKGPASRNAERTWRLTRNSRAFVTDAVPGRHWVLQVSALLELHKQLGKGGAGSRGSPGASHGGKGEEGCPVETLLVLESAADMQDWLGALRAEIESLGVSHGRSVDAVAQAPGTVAAAVTPSYPVSPSSDMSTRPSDSPRGSWNSSAASATSSATSSYQPSADAASAFSRLSSVEDRSPSSLRQSVYSRDATSPLTPASSMHALSPSESLGGRSLGGRGRVARTFFCEESDTESPGDTEDEICAATAEEDAWMAKRREAGGRTDVVVRQENDGAGTVMQCAALGDEIRAPAITSQSGMADATHNRGALPRVLEGDLGAIVDAEEDCPGREMAMPSGGGEEEAQRGILIPIPIPPRSHRRLSGQIQIPVRLQRGGEPDREVQGEVAMQQEVQAIPLFAAPMLLRGEDRVMGAGMGMGKVRIQFWGPKAAVVTGDVWAQSKGEGEGGDDGGLALMIPTPPPSIQSQIRQMRALREGLE